MARLGTDSNTLEVTYKSPILNAKGNPTKKSITRKSVVHLSNILIVDENYDDKGKLIENTCRIYYADIGWLILEESYEEVSTYLLGNAVKIKGFSTK